MRRGSLQGPIERFAVTEELARRIYTIKGCVVPRNAPRDYMHKSSHPQEQFCVAAALVAIELLMK